MNATMKVGRVRSAWAAVVGMLLWVGAGLPQAWASVSVTLTAPTNGALFTAPANITLTATATAGQGYTVSKVEFFQGATLIGTVTSAPYTFNWTNVAAGPYTLTAKATDNQNATTTSAPVNITVETAPTVSISSPANNAVFTAPANITVTATAADSDGTIQKVDFFQGATLIGTATTSPYSVNWTNVASGAYTLTAVATDNLGLTTPSSPVAINVDIAPTVSLSSPANNATFTAPANVTLTATAADSDGTIQKVDFYRGGSTLIATVTSAPYSFDWSNVQAGPYTLTAVATDNLGITTTSDPVAITVNQGIAQLYFIHTDHLNTPRLISDTVGQTVWTWANDDPFGANAPNENPSGLGNFTCNLRLPGQYFDRETNTHYNYFRDYDPGIGRYIQSDPIGLLGGINSYAYVDGNPISLTDPLGLFDLPSIPQPALDFVTGISDAASLGLGPIVRNALDVSGGVDVCSGSYTVGQYASLFLGAGRLAYAGAAKALPLLVPQGATSLNTALAVSAARNTLKQAARLGTFPNYRTYTAQQVLAKYGADPAAITAAATRTNPAVNAVGANLAIGAAVGRATCGCQ